MKDLAKIVAAHPLDQKPYHNIRFSRLDGQKRPLYMITGEKKELGAYRALRAAFERFGGHCFHCSNWMPAQKLSQEITRDHLKPKSCGGEDHLHNLVISCGTCNRKKAGHNLIDFNVERGRSYLDALDHHITNCLAALPDV